MNDPKVFYLPCPNAACPSNRKRGKAKEPILFERVELVALDSGYDEVSVVVMYRCPHCQQMFERK
jgi:hypothetical protein